MNVETINAERVNLCVETAFSTIMLHGLELLLGIFHAHEGLY
jgi:hypothetical protein